MRNIVVLGSTGSVGTQALNVIRDCRRSFRITGLACGKNKELIKQQAQEFGVPRIVVGDHDATMQLVTDPAVDMVVFAMSHTPAGVDIFRAALAACKRILMASKEVIIEFGPSIKKYVVCANPQIIPLDSEMSAIFQILRLHSSRTVKKVYIPCTGGPFYGRSREELHDVTIEQAVAHPRWKMGRKISVDSATLMNKAFEVIEAAYLFGFNPDCIQIFMEPAARIHAVVEFDDGECVTHCEEPDMRYPIEYALRYPEIRRRGGPPRRAAPTATLATFQQPDYSVFPGPELAYRSLRDGKNAVGGVASMLPLRLLYANNEAVALFLNGDISFLGIYDFIKNKI